MKNENDILSKIPSDMPIGPYLLGYAQAVHDLNKDWDTFRREAAKDILAGMMSNVPLSEYGNTDAECMAEYAVLYADKLIKRLKEGEK